MTQFEALITALAAGLMGIGYTAAKIRKIAGFIDFFARLPTEYMQMQASVAANTDAIKDLTLKLAALADLEARRAAAGAP